MYRHMFAGLAVLAIVLAVGATTAEPAVAETEDVQTELDQFVERLRPLGLQITGEQGKIASTVSEAAYFMFAQRKDFQPRREKLEPPESGHWLDRKPVFDARADREAIRPLFDALVERMGYDRVSVYQASVHYGVSGFARFTLYKLDCSGDAVSGRPAVLLGDADYVLNLP